MWPLRSLHASFTPVVVADTSNDGWATTAVLDEPCAANWSESAIVDDVALAVRNTRARICRLALGSCSLIVLALVLDAQDASSYTEPTSARRQSVSTSSLNLSEARAATHVTTSLAAAPPLLPSSSPNPQASKFLDASFWRLKHREKYQPPPSLPPPPLQPSLTDQQLDEQRTYLLELRLRQEAQVRDGQTAAREEREREREAHERQQQERVQREQQLEQQRQQQRQRQQQQEQEWRESRQHKSARQFGSEQQQLSHHTQQLSNQPQLLQQQQERLSIQQPQQQQQLSSQQQQRTDQPQQLSQEQLQLQQHGQVRSSQGQALSVAQQQGQGQHAGTPIVVQCESDECRHALGGNVYRAPPSQA